MCDITHQAGDRGWTHSIAQDQPTKNPADALSECLSQERHQHSLQLVTVAQIASLAKWEVVRHEGYICIFIKALSHYNSLKSIYNRFGSLSQCALKSHPNKINTLAPLKRLLDPPKNDVYLYPLQCFVCIAAFSFLSHLLKVHHYTRGTKINSLASSFQPKCQSATIYFLVHENCDGSISF